MRKQIISTVILSICFVSYLFAGNNHGAAFMRMGVGARALSMGGAFTGVSDDISSVYWNPAGLTRLEGSEFGSMYAPGLGLDRSLNYVGVGSKIFLGTVAVSWVNAAWRGFQGYDESDNYTQDFDIVENNLALSYALSIAVIRIGGSFKFYSSSIQNQTDVGFGADVGAMLYLSDKLQIGVMIRDLYSSLGDDIIPIQMNVGIGVQPIDNFLVAGDVRMLPLDMGVTKYAYGCEYILHFNKLIDFDARFAARLGMENQSMRGGFGIGYAMFDFNYAYIPKPIDVFSDSHRFSIVMKF